MTKPNLAVALRLRFKVPVPKTGTSLPVLLGYIHSGFRFVFRHPVRSSTSHLPRVQEQMTGRSV